jgi:HSP90 family molecular chaperone
MTSPNRSGNPYQRGRSCILQFAAVYPGQDPFNYYTKEYEKGLQLYSNGVLIMDKCPDLLPDYFSFVKGLVDSQDLSLNFPGKCCSMTGS